MNGVHFDLHGLAVSIATPDADLLAFARAHFDAEPGEDEGAALRIRASWHWGAGEDPHEPAEDGAGERAGRGLIVTRGGDADDAAVRAHWRRVPDFPELGIAFTLSGGMVPRLEVDASCAYRPRGLGRRIEYFRQGRVDRKRNRLFFKLMYFMVYYPMAWYLDRTRGWGLLHASSVVLPSGKAVILSGLGGVGKSTLGLALLSRPGSRLLSDNLVFHDDRRIYSCPEPVRLDETALAGMAGSGVEPERTDLPLTAHPKPTYRVGSGMRAETGSPRCVFFLRFAPKPGVTPISPERASELLLAGNDLAREIKDYRATSALLTMIAAERGRPDRAPRSSLGRLLEGARCAILRIGAGEQVETTAARIDQAVEASL